MKEKMEAVNPNSGEFILGQLRRFGSDLNRKHEVSFWLYFPTEDSARHAAQRAEVAGLRPEVSPPLKDIINAKWLCLLYCPHVPDESLLDGIGHFCAELAIEFNGDFDGWEASLELVNGANPTNHSSATRAPAAGPLDSQC